MGFELAFNPVKFDELLVNVRKSYPSYEEFIRMDHKIKTTALLESIAAVGDDALPRYASTLKNSEIGIVLPALAACEDDKLCGLLGDVLVLRFKKKLFELNWIMLQEDYSNTRLLKSMERLAGCLKDQYPPDFENCVFSRINDWEGCLAEKIHGLLVGESLDIRRFFKRYSLEEESALGRRVCELFFLNCGREGYIRNKASFAGLMDHLGVEEAARVFSHYLAELDVFEYFDDVNFAVSKKSRDQAFGDFWLLIPKECLERFLRWEDLKRVEAHFGKGSRKFGLWAGYFAHVRHVEDDGHGGLIFMDFGDFVVVDFPNEEGVSYLYKKKYFESELDRCEELKAADTDTAGSWRVIQERVVEARDLIIEDVKSEVYRIGYDRVQLLYLKEIIKVSLKL